MKRLLCLLSLLALVPPSLRAARGDEPLPSDPRIQTGVLANGVKWIGRPHAVPPGKICLLLHVAAGSLQETDEQRGLAHFLVHMAFRGTENFPPGAVVPYFQSIGMEFGPENNAFADYDQTFYFLMLPDTTAEQIEKGLMLLSDFAFRMMLVEREIEQERAVVLTELRGAAPQQRMRDKLFEKLFEGSRLSRRMPIGNEQVVVGAPRSQFVDYVRAWYRPEYMTVIWVGDTTGEAVLPLLEKWFAHFKAPGEARPRQGMGLQPFDRRRVIVIADPQVDQCDIDAYRLLPGHGPTTTYERKRLELLEEMVNWIMGRRFTDRIRLGTTACRNAYAQLNAFFTEGRLADICTAGDPNDWPKLVEELAVEINRAREHGFLPGELELCKSDLLATHEDAVRKEADRPSRNILFEIANGVRLGEPVMSAQQRLDALKKLLPTISAADVTKLFREVAAPERLTWVMTAPKKEGVAVPSEQELTAAIEAALALPVEAPRDVKRPGDLLRAPPQPGKLGEVVQEELAGEGEEGELLISRGWLDNGARVCHRWMGQRKDTVLVNILLAGGQIEETAANVGVTQAAARIMAQPATKRLTSTELQDILTGTSVTVGGSAEDDALVISLNGPPKEIEVGLRLAHALLTEGKLEPSAMEVWKQQMLQQHTMASKLPQYAGFNAFLGVITGNDPRRPSLLTPEQLDRLTVEAAQAWFERLCREAPLTVTVVGDIRLAEVQPLLETYIGSLPKRSRSLEHLEPLRAIRREPGPIFREVTAENALQSWVVMGFVGADAKNAADVRALNVASDLLDTRLTRRLRQELNIAFMVGCQNRTNGAYRDGSFFMTMSACPPDKPAQVAKEIAAMYAAFAESGPTETELAEVKKRIASKLASEVVEPQFWLTCLTSLDLRGLALNDFQNAVQLYEALTAEQVRDAFRKYSVPQHSVQVIVVPAPATQPAPAATQKAAEAAPPAAATGK